MQISKQEWQPPKDIKPWMVCAALKCQEYIILGARHFDLLMQQQINTIKLIPNYSIEKWTWEQGFIDQFGRFYTREEAIKAVKENEQPFNIERNGGKDDKLFSEGLY